MRPHWAFGMLAVTLLAAPALGAEKSRGLSVVRAPTGGDLRGRNWLLVIGINDYKHWFSLDGPTA